MTQQDESQIQLSPTRSARAPLRLALILAVCIFLIEFAIMGLFALLPPIPYWLQALADSTLLIALLTPVMLLGVVRPLTLQIDAHEQAEVALRESEARHKAVTESALDAIVTNDKEGRITMFNPAAERTFGGRQSRTTIHEQRVTYHESLPIQPDLPYALKAGDRNPVALDSKLEVPIGIPRLPSAFPFACAPGSLRVVRITG